MTRKGKSHFSMWMTFGGHPRRRLSATKSASAETTVQLLSLAPLPDSFVGGLFKTNVPDVGQSCKQSNEPFNQARGKIFVQDQGHPKFALRPASAAY
jgi:hypothetical protein